MKNTDPNDAVLRALEAIERRLTERIDRLESRLVDEAESVRVEINTLRGDVAGLAREIIEQTDRSVRDAEARLRADDEQNRGRSSGA